MGFSSVVSQYHRRVQSCNTAGSFAWRGVDEAAAGAILSQVYPQQVAEKLRPLALEWALRRLAGECPAAALAAPRERRSWASCHGLAYVPLSAKRGRQLCDDPKQPPHALVDWALAEDLAMAPLQLPRAVRSARVTIVEACRLLEAESAETPRRRPRGSPAVAAVSVAQLLGAVPTPVKKRRVSFGDARDDLEESPAAHGRAAQEGSESALGAAALDKEQREAPACDAADRQGADGPLASSAPLSSDQAAPPEGSPESAAMDASPADVMASNPKPALGAAACGRGPRSPRAPLPREESAPSEDADVQPSPATAGAAHPEPALGGFLRDGGPRTPCACSPLEWAALWASADGGASPAHAEVEEDESEEESEEGEEESAVLGNSASGLARTLAARTGPAADRIQPGSPMESELEPWPRGSGSDLAVPVIDLEAPELCAADEAAAELAEDIPCTPPQPPARADDRASPEKGVAAQRGGRAAQGCGAWAAERCAEQVRCSSALEPAPDPEDEVPLADFAAARRRRAALRGPPGGLAPRAAAPTPDSQGRELPWLCRVLEGPAPRI